MKKFTVSILSIGLMLSMVFSSNVFATPKVEEAPIGVAYRGHVENEGNMPKPEGMMVAGPEVLGTRGQGLRIEGFWIELTGDDIPVDAGISYEVHVENKGWMKAVKNGDFAGTSGEGLRVESIKIALVNLPDYDVYYRGHVQNRGDIPVIDGNEDSWGWLKNGTELGTVGEGLRLEELQIKIVKKSDLTAYQLLLDEIETLNEAIYTPESFKILQDTKINNVITSEDSQGDIEAASQAIQEALDALIRVIDADLADAKAAEALLIAADYGDYSDVTAALALPEASDDEITMKTNAIIDAIEALVVKYEDLRSAALVSDQIDALPEAEEVVAADRPAIAAARAAYDRLTIDQQVFISETILAKLVAVEAELKDDSNVVRHDIKVELNDFYPIYPRSTWRITGSIKVVRNGILGSVTANGQEITMSGWRYRDALGDTFKIRPSDINSVEKVNEIQIIINNVTETIKLD